jgi:hypothetical protein
VSSLPEGLSTERNLEVAATRAVWLRRTLLGCIAVLPVLSLLNVFGQHPTTTSANAPAAHVNVTAPARLRSGLIFQVRVQVDAHREIKNLEVVFDKGWWESVSVNSSIPEPSEQSSENGRVAFVYGKVPAGQSHVSWIYFQVNPTDVAERSENVEVRDGEKLIARLHRSITIFP